MDLGVLLTLAAAGLGVGFLSGLIGIGGGVMIVPLLYFFYGHPTFDSGVSLSTHSEAVVAHATSLFVILPTAILGTWTYQRAEMVAWRAALPIAATSMVSALTGALIAPRLPTPWLKLGFGLLLLASGLQMLRPRHKLAPAPRRAHIAIASVAGLGIGFMSALLGVGGGILAIPVLVYLLGLELEKVAATSMAIIVFTASAALVGYVFAGASAVGMPAGSVGYIHVVSGLPILAGSLLAVPLGAAANQRMATARLRLIFGFAFIAYGIRLVIQNFALAVY